MRSVANAMCETLSIYIDHPQDKAVDETIPKPHLEPPQTGGKFATVPR
jgi:hypothetical protein